MALLEGTKIIEIEPNIGIEAAIEVKDAVEVFSCTMEAEKGDVSIEYKPMKSWKKSLSNFFRHLPRSTKSNDGDVPSISTRVSCNLKAWSPEQKWQSLGKIFRKQSMIDYGRSQESRNQYGESSSQSQPKRVGIKKMFTGYFQKDAYISKSIAKAKK